MMIFDFERYIKYYEATNGQNQFLLEMNNLEKLISKYNPLDSDELILSDPKWIVITNQAKIVYERSNSYIK